MSNEAIAVLLTAFYIICSRKLDLCFAILTYYIACILTNANTGLQYATTPEWFYIQQSGIDLAAIVFICYLSKFHRQASHIYAVYAAIITLSMCLNGLMLIDQYTEAHSVYQWHMAYQRYAQAIDVFFAVIGSAHVAKYIVAFLPFSSR